jgi:hypothetical protein
LSCALSLSEVLADPPQVVEDGWDAKENAARKALAYSRATGLPVLARLCARPASVTGRPMKQVVH